jgi:hypothetical protein
MIFPADAERLTMKKPLTFLVALSACAGTAVWAQSSLTLSYKGTVSKVRIVDGRPYVALSDVARMLHGQVSKNGGSYAIGSGKAVAGGANQVDGLRGKVGDTLFTGKWRFQITRVEHVSVYNTTLQPSVDTFHPKGANQELVVCTGVLKNARKAVGEFQMTMHGTSDTALTDDQGVSYPPIGYDPTNGGFYGPPKMLPGSAQPFAAIFSVPKGANLKDLVFSVWGYGEKKPTDVRISLQP